MQDELYESMNSEEGRSKSWAAIQRYREELISHST